MDDVIEADTSHIMFASSRNEPIMLDLCDVIDITSILQGFAAQVRDEQPVRIRVSDVNDELPVFRNVPRPFLATVSANAAPGTSVYQLMAQDADEDSVVRYQLESGGEDRFEIDSLTGVVRTRGTEPFPHGKEYEIGVSAHDISVRTVQRSPTHSLRILVGERDPQFFEPQYIAGVPETETEQYRVVEVKALSHQGFPLTYELSTDTGQHSNDFAIDPNTGVVDLLRKLDYEKDPHQFHLRVKVIENGRPARSSTVNMEKTKCSDHAVMLEEYWDKGLKSLSAPEAKVLVGEIISATSLNYKQIKNWLGDRRRKEAGKPHPPRKEKLCNRQKSGRDLYFQKALLNDETNALPGEKLRKVAHEWRALKNTAEGASYIATAKSMPVFDPEKADGIPLVQFVEKQMCKITDLIASLALAGVEALVLSYSTRDGQIYTTGTEKGKGFTVKRPDLVNLFMSHVSDGSANIPLTLQELRLKVMTLMNQKYNETTGQRTCAYSAIKSGEVILEGLPNGLEFNEPWSCGRKRLQMILEMHDQLSFRRAVSPSLIASTCGPLVLPSSSGLAVEPTTSVVPTTSCPLVLPSSSGLAVLSSTSIPSFFPSTSVPIRSSRKRKMKKESCRGCGIVEGSTKDRKKGDGWIKCWLCPNWLHETCAQLYGSSDCLYFTCSECK